MSAITGIFYRDGRKVDPELIKKMNDRLSHRGPDGSAVWCEGSVALGHQMLWTTPESLHEKLPFEDENSGLVITADARIDNRDELSKELDIEDKEEVSDSYFILKAYLRWGESCPEHLLGDFAFAIWDKNEEKLFCARDHMGVKPFYYYLSNDAFFFATEIKSIMSIPGTPNEINKLKVADYLVNNFDNREITFYEGILRLPAAHILTIDFNSIQSLKYWELDTNKKIRMDSDEEYVRAFLKIFRESVKCRLRSISPIGSLLSGGLDSSSIVCIARKILSEENKESLKTFSATFNEVPECDEQEYINEILKYKDIEPNFIKADQISPLSNSDKVLWYLEEPCIGHNHYIIWHLFKKARENKVKVIFDGHGGDNTVFYNERFLIDYIFAMQWKKGIDDLIKRSKHVNVSVFTIILRSFLLPLTPVFLIKLIALLPIDIGMVENFNLLNKNLIEETGIKKRFYEKKLYPFKSAKKTNDLHYYVLNYGSFQYMFETEDKMAAANKLEVRYPFFDRRLIEFCLALPPEQKSDDGWDRIIMRRAMKDILPFKVQWRQQKSSLDPNFRRRILFEKHVLYDLIFNHDHVDIEYFNMDYVNKIYMEYDNKKGSNVKLGKIINLIQWLHKNNKF